MRCIEKMIRSLCAMLAAAACTVPVAHAQTAPSISDVPLFLNAGVPPLNMIVLGRDHKLYYEAYNDASDLDGDGTLDTRYKPSIDYYGYFDSYKCYTYSSADGRFNPASVTANKQCSGQWSGDFLNYLTTSRIDALRKVLYGGLRSNDPTGVNGATILERSFIPQDAHSWGKEYTSVAVDGYNIANYTPYALPNANTRHLFANTTPLNTTNPLLRVLLNQGTVNYQNANHQVRIWNWVSIERPVAGTRVMHGGNGPTVTPTDLIVRVRVCVAGLLEPNCRQYPNGNRKPIGLLQEFGENDAMYFGLLSGSYASNTNGGVLRRNIGSIRDEINVTTNGTFTSFAGIITTLNRLSVTGFGTNHEYSCGWISNRAINAGECQMWGNPVAEMMYEAQRYFAGRANPTGSFSTAFGAGQEANLAGGGLPVASWSNPYNNRPYCSKPFQTVVSDINPSYDSDTLPGSSFGSAGDTLGGMDVTALGQQIWDAEYGGTRKVFIGQSGAVVDGAPTPKDVSSFGNIRGLAPEEPTKQGSYYSASVAHHGRKMEIGALNDAAADSTENVNTFAVALASPLPRIDIPVNGQTVTLVPFAKSIYGDFGGAIRPDGNFQPTNQIVDFYVESLTPTTGSFRVNFEDVEQGADHDMDAVARYQYQVNANGTVTVNVTSEYAAGSIVQHMGYIVSGSTADGTYLVVRDCDTQGACPGSSQSAANDHDYFLDTPPAFTGTPPAPSSGAQRWNDGIVLPHASSRTFTPGAQSAATLLKDPLWYAAKWGGFKDSNDNLLPDVATEWDADGDGNPDNYFLVTNALRLGDQLTSAFNEILARSGSASSASVNSGSISSETRIYQAKFNSGDWSGQLLSFRVEADGSLATSEEWDAARRLSTVSPTNRRIITVNSNGTQAVPFRWADAPNGIDATRRAQLQQLDNATVGEFRLNYLRGDGAREDQNVATDPQFRNRPQTPFRNVLGDIVSSAPMFVGRPPFLYPDIFPGGSETPYSTFVANNQNRQHMVYAGANDGMLHGFDAQTGDERLAFIPGATFGNLHELTRPSYTHRYYVDGPPTMGDAFFGGSWHTVLVGGLNKGGNSIYALDVTNPGAFSEANAAQIFLWEYTDVDLGYTYSRPAVVRMQSGRWAAIFGSGYPDGLATGKAALYVVDIENGNLIRKIDTGVGTGGNGLSTPALVDLNGDSIVDLAYAGDLAGNMWKFDLRGADPNAWGVAYSDGGGNALPLFTALDASNAPQPITSRPEVGRGPRGAGTMVLFGTGRYLGVADKTPTQTQTFYGIHDPHTMTDTDRVGGRGVLTSQQIIVEQPFAFTTPDGGTVTASVRVTTANAVNNRGWYLDLLQPPNPPGTFQGEMQVSDSILRSGRIIFTTLIPDANPCTVGGTSWLMELDALTGSRLGASPFDLNRDVEFDEDDYVEVDIDGDGVPDLAVPVSGIQSEVGITPKPGILAGPNAEYKYTPGTTGEIQVTVENPGEAATGRQSWRQIR